MWGCAVLLLAALALPGHCSLLDGECNGVLHMEWPPLSFQRDHVTLNFTSDIVKMSLWSVCKAVFSVRVFTVVGDAEAECSSDCSSVPTNCTALDLPNATRKQSNLVSIVGGLMSLGQCVEFKVTHIARESQVNVTGNNWCGALGVAFAVGSTCYVQHTPPARAGHVVPCLESGRPFQSESVFTLKPQIQIPTVSGRGVFLLVLYLPVPTLPSYEDAYIMDFAVDTVTANSTCLRLVVWNMDCVANLEVRICKEDLPDVLKDCRSEAINISTTATLYTISSLIPCATYRAKLILISTLDSQEQSKELTFTTSYLSPGPVRNVETEKVSWNIIKMRWDPPINSLKCLSEYSITVQYDENVKGATIFGQSFNKTVEATETSVELDKLLACRLYKIIITSVGRLGPASSTPEIPEFTYDDKDDAATIAHLRVNSVDQTFFTIAFDIPAVFTGRSGKLADRPIDLCISGFNIRVESSSSQDVVFVDRQPDSQRQTFSLGSQQPCTEYSVTVAIWNYNLNNRETIKWSRPVTVTTSEMLPGHVTDLEVIASDTSVSLKWNAPLDGAACVLGYSVKFFELDFKLFSQQWSLPFRKSLSDGCMSSVQPSTPSTVTRSGSFSKDTLAQTTSEKVPPAARWTRPARTTTESWRASSVPSQRTIASLTTILTPTLTPTTNLAPTPTLTPTTNLAHTPTLILAPNLAPTPTLTPTTNLAPTPTLISTANVAPIPSLTPTGAQTPTNPHPQPAALPTTAPATTSSATDTHSSWSAPPHQPKTKSNSSASSASPTSLSAFAQSFQRARSQTGASTRSDETDYRFLTCQPCTSISKVQKRKAAAKALQKMILNRATKTWSSMWSLPGGEQSCTPTDNSVKNRVGCVTNDLNSCSHYMAVISPVSISNRSGEANCIVFVTKSAVPAPGEGIIVWRRATQVALQWDLDNVHSSCGTINKISVQVCSVDGNGCSMHYDNIEGQESPTLVIRNLDPETTYECKAKFQIVSDGETEESAESPPLLVTTTASAGSDAPTQVEISDDCLMWTDGVNAIDTAYYVNVSIIQRPPLFSTVCSEKVPARYILQTQPNQFSCGGLNEVLPGATSFEIRVRALGGVNMSEAVTLSTPEKRPGRVLSFYPVEDPATCGKDFINSLYLKIFPPCESNGLIEYYRLGVIPTTNNQKKDSIQPFDTIIKLEEFYHESFGYALLPLESHFAENNYHLSLFQSETLNLTLTPYNALGEGETFTYSYYMIPNILPRFSASNKSRMSVSVEHTLGQGSVATVKFPLGLFDMSGGSDYYALVLAEEGQEGLAVDGCLAGTLDADTWGEANKGAVVTTYQPMAPGWSPFKGLQNSPDSDLDIFATFRLGTDVTCPQQPTTTYCNGPLKSATVYSVRVRVVSWGLEMYVESPSVYFNTSDVGEHLLMYGIVGAGTLLIIVFTVITIRWTCKRRATGRRRKRLQSMRLHTPLTGAVGCLVRGLLGGLVRGLVSGATRRVCRGSRSTMLPQPYSVRHFKEFCAQVNLTDCNRTLQNEFEVLCALSAQYAASTPCRVGSLPHNLAKNRYSNIIPFDKNRVKLGCSEDDDIANYINASFIAGFTEKIEYIASQGPKEETTRDFWFMVYEQKVRLIIMLTSLKEKDKVKCHRYFPDLGDRFMWGDLVVGCSVVNDLNAYTLRTFVMHKGAEQRLVHHLYYREWPDFGCPEVITPVLQFCFTVRKHASLFPGMMLVHCSAGVGRTGTLIALDILLQCLKGKKQIDVFGVVMKLREQRSFMVQSQTQYCFIYKCLKAAIEAPPEWKNKAPCPFIIGTGSKALRCQK